MASSSTRRRVEAWAIATVMLIGAMPAAAGPWSELPDAVGRLSDRPADDDAARVVRLAETSVMREAREGRVDSARELFDTYASLVADLADGSRRLATLERRLAAELLTVGDRVASADPGLAVRSWGLAVELAPGSDAAERLRRFIFPPDEAEPGEVWRARLDDARLVYHPPMTVRLGCTEGDGACRDNEVIFTWEEVAGFWVEAHEVSNRRYRQCVYAGVCSAPADTVRFNDPERADEPVVGVTWQQARVFARWVGRRLPTEAEWERAARGETAEARFPWGNGRRRDLANVWQDPRFGGANSLLPVGGYPATGFGLFDVAGNVWEWCRDRYRDRFTADDANGQLVHAGVGRVVRGGSWRRAIDMSRVSSRSWYDEGYAADDVGFRCVVGAARDASADELVRIARRAFPAGAAAGRELRNAALEPEDRRFLERRAMTLLVVEGRLAEALLPAALRLASDAEDPVASDLVERFEETLLADASGDDLAAVEPGLTAYRRAVVEHPGLAPRLARLERRLLRVLRRTVSDLRMGGEDATALEAARIGLTIAPDDAVFQAAASRLALRNGAIRVWPRDGKGMVWIERRRFRFGASPNDTAAQVDEVPPVAVTVGGFWIDRTEVTNDEYRSCVTAGACTPPNRTEFYDDPRLGGLPVVHVNWFQARAYASWAGKRLPSETEWELAARSGASTAFPWGASWVIGRANAMGTYRDDVWSGPAPVASFEANRWGVYDLIGNVSEWVEDVYHDDLEGVPRNGRPWYQETGPASERRRVVRNAGHDDPPPKHRVSRRRGRRADTFNRSIGFRCAADEARY